MKQRILPLKCTTASLPCLTSHPRPLSSCSRSLVVRYPLTFLAAFVWVSFFSFTISAVAGRWNSLSGLPLSLFGIVLVAVGAEIPDTISSLAVARRGYGSMAISNSCGSQITNIVTNTASSLTAHSNASHRHQLILRLPSPSLL
jgi:Ca2+/Na+ antiporter